MSLYDLYMWFQVCFYCQEIGSILSCLLCFYEWGGWTHPAVLRSYSLFEAQGLLLLVLREPSRVRDQSRVRYIKAS